MAHHKRSITSGLERELSCELNAAWTAATEERVADSYVASGRQVIAANAHLAISTQLKTVRSGIRNEGWQERIGEVWVVQDIEEIDTELHVKPLCNRRVLIHGEIPLFELRPSK